MVDVRRALAGAREAAREAGLLLRAPGAARTLAAKSEVELLTEADVAADRALRTRLSREFPEWGVESEESGATGRRDVRWVVDPLDGTTNFVHGYPYFCVCVALVDRGEPVVGVVHDPSRDETFAAAAGHGADLDGSAIRVSARSRLAESLVATPFSHALPPRWEPYLAAFAAAQERSRGVRRGGSAALDLAWLAAGRLDGFWTWATKLWDVAAGVALVREAGGTVTTFAGARWDGEEDLVASNAVVHDELLALLGEAAGGCGVIRT